MFEVASIEMGKNHDKHDWEGLINKMLPEGTPLIMEEADVDHSIAMVYSGPPVSHEIPTIEPVYSDFASIPSAEFAVSRSSNLPIPDPTPLSIAHLSSLTNSPSRRSHSSDSVISVLQKPKFSSTSPSGFHDSNYSLVTNEVKRDRSMATFCTVNGNNSERIEINEEGPVYTEYVGVSKKGRKKRSCFRCGKGKWENKECCLVCGVRYCSSCVLRAMGSMPEGRKCVTCIGHPIDESKRRLLGKCSRMLSRILSPLEMGQIMKAEKECQANQLHPEQLIVNKRPLKQEELMELLSCKMPPQKLKPGRYWYDKESGLWGKEGEKPDRIISSHLSFSGKISRDASNGNTEVYINGREITKIELKILKWANVQCPRDTHFWVYDDGGYEEEGQNLIKGKIWEKKTTRLACLLFSLPMPRENSCRSNTSDSGRIGGQVGYDQSVHKLLFLGPPGSGTSTIFKQAKYLYEGKFTQEELEDIKLVIQRNIFKYLGILLEARERFEEDALYMMKQKDLHLTSEGKNEDVKEGQCVYSIMNPKLKHFSNWLLDIIATGDLDTFFPAASHECGPLVEDVWNDPAIQETYKRRSELYFLPDVAPYFLSRATEISSNSYDPSERDIIYAEGLTQGNGLTFIEFTLDERSPISVPSFDDATKSPLSPTLTKYQLIRISSQGMNEGCKWVDMFDDVRVVIFCVALSDYDQLWAPDNGKNTPLQNKMMKCKELFETMIQHSCFNKTPFVLLLNKFDTFQEKINQVPLSSCEWFSDFSPVRRNQRDQSLACQAYYFIAKKFKELYASLTKQKLFVYQVRARDRSTVDEAFKYIKEVLKWDDEKQENINKWDEPFFSTECSSLPYTRQEEL